MKKKVSVAMQQRVATSQNVRGDRITRDNGATYLSVEKVHFRNFFIILLSTPVLINGQHNVAGEGKFEK
jgi:hypothetical protein